MNKLFISALIVLSSANALANEVVINDLQALFKSNIYTGTTGEGEGCKVQVSKRSESIDIAVTPASFDFYGGDKGSSQCMYTKACFSLDSSIKILSIENSGSSSVINVLRPGGGPDLAAKKKMSLILEQGQKGMKVTAIEKVGLFNLGTVESSCIINLK